MPTYTAQQLKDTADQSAAQAQSIFDQLMLDMHAAAQAGGYQVAFPVCPSTQVHDQVAALITALNVTDNEYDLEGAGDPIVYTLIKWDNPTGA